MQCPKCNAQVPEDSGTCDKCGAPLDAQHACGPVGCAQTTKDGGTKTPCRGLILGSCIGGGVVVVAGIVIMLLLLLGGGGSKELNEWCEKIELDKAEELGPVVKEFLIARESGNGGKVWDMMASNRKKEIEDVPNQIKPKSVLESQLEMLKKEMEKAKDEDKEKWEGKVEFAELVIDKYDSLKEMSNKELFIWTINNNPDPEAEMKDSFKEAPEFKVTGEEIKDNDGEIKAKMVDSDRTFPFATLKKEDGEWRIIRVSGLWG